MYLLFIRFPLKSSVSCVPSSITTVCISAEVDSQLSLFNWHFLIGMEYLLPEQYHCKASLAGAHCSGAGGVPQVKTFWARWPGSSNIWVTNWDGLKCWAAEVILRRTLNPQPCTVTLCTPRTGCFSPASIICVKSLWTQRELFSQTFIYSG